MHLPVAAPAAGDGDGLVQAGQRAAHIADVLIVRIALHVAQPDVGIGEIHLQLRIGRGIFGGAVQMLQDSAHQQFLGGSRAGEFLNGVVDFRKQTVAELAQVFRAGLRRAALGVGDSRLPQHAADSRHHGCANQRRGGQSQLVPARELAGAIAEVAPMGRHRTALEIRLQIGDQALHAGVALLRLFAEGFQNDGVNVGIERAGRGLRAGLRRLLLADHAHHFGGGELLQLIGRHAGREKKEKHAQRVDVGRGRDRAVPTPARGWHIAA